MFSLRSEEAGLNALARKAGMRMISAAPLRAPECRPTLRGAFAFDVYRRRRIVAASQGALFGAARLVADYIRLDLRAERT